MTYINRSFFDPLPGREIEAQAAEAIVAMCIFGEARGADVQAKAAVASVLLTRANDPRPGRFFPKALLSNPLVTRAAACALKPYAFSCFLFGDPNRSKLLDGWKSEPQAWRECVAVAAAALDGLLKDPTAGGNHYISYSLLDFAKGRWPGWAKPGQESAVVGRFRFFRLA